MRDPVPPICSAEMPRRAFMAVIAGGLLAAPLVTAAQPGRKVTQIGVLLGSTRAEDLPQSEGLRHGLRELGYVEGQNIVIEYRWAEGRFERLPGLAAELAALKLAVIVAFGTQASLAAKKATSTIPIVMVAVGDPVRRDSWRVSPARAETSPESSTTRSRSVRQIASSSSRRSFPSVRRVAILWNPANALRRRWSREAEAQPAVWECSFTC